MRFVWGLLGVFIAVVFSLSDIGKLEFSKCLSGLQHYYNKRLNQGLELIGVQ